MGVLNFTGLRQGLGGQAGSDGAITAKPEVNREKNKQPGSSSSRAGSSRVANAASVGVAGTDQASACTAKEPHQSIPQETKFALMDKLNGSGFCVGCVMLSVDGLGSDAERRWCMRRASKESAYKFEFRHIAAEVKVWQCPRVKDGCAHRALS